MATCKDERETQKKEALVSQASQIMACVSWVSWKAEMKGIGKASGTYCRTERRQSTGSAGARIAWLSDSGGAAGVDSPSSSVVGFSAHAAHPSAVKHLGTTVVRPVRVPRFPGLAFLCTGPTSTPEQGCTV